MYIKCVLNIKKCMKSKKKKKIVRQKCLKYPQEILNPN